jgi:hypothetical protein
MIEEITVREPRAERSVNGNVGEIRDAVGDGTEMAGP